MAKQEASVDPQLYERAVSLFATKRSALPPETVSLLANDIVRRLARAIEQVPTQEVPEISGASLAAFCETLVHADPAAALSFISARRAEGVSRDGIYFGYISAAARQLGDLWDEDLLSFVDVTVGTGHLYALLRALRAEGSFGRPAFDVRRYAVFATVPGEDHGIGITIAADLFREAGWEIDLHTVTDHESLLTHMERAAPTVIGLSLSTEHRLDELMRLVVAIRIAMPHVIIGVAPGSSLDERRLTSLVDIDLVIRDVHSSRAELERRIALGS
ncbi:MAG: B12-binding domain-containing protein [Hyphomonas sp.]